jgi:hypothetical protein
MNLNNDILAKVPAWQGFFRQKSIEFLLHPASAAPASGFLLTAVSKANFWVKANRN